MKLCLSKFLFFVLEWGGGNYSHYSIDKRNFLLKFKHAKEQFLPQHTNYIKFNPNSTGQGQSWPCQLWRQIPDKILIYQIFILFDLFLQKHLPNLFELLTWPQKMTFWRTFWRFFVRNSVASLLCRHPRFRPVLMLLQTTRAREKSGRTEVRSAERRQ